MHRQKDTSTETQNILTWKPPKGKNHGVPQTPRNESLYVEGGIQGDSKATTSSSSSSNDGYIVTHTLTLTLSLSLSVTEATTHYVTIC